jgi:hypothetical protein
MSKDFTRAPIKRRTVLQAGLAIGAAQIASPFVVKSLADEPVKIGLDNPLTGTYAALGKNELFGAQLALSQINAKGGILGRPVQLLVEESTSGDAGTAVEKARKLIDRDQVNFLSATSTRRWPPRSPTYPMRRASSTWCPAVTPIQLPAPIATGTSSASATPRRWKPTLSLAR